MVLREVACTSRNGNVSHCETRRRVDPGQTARVTLSTLPRGPDFAISVAMATPATTLRAEHSVVAKAFHACELSKARRIILVSAHSGDGKTYLANCISRHAGFVTERPVRVETLLVVRHLRIEGSGDEDADGFLWVDGLSLLDGEGASALTPGLRDWLDGALLVARGMVTTRREVADCADRLRMLGVPVLGGVWNDVDCPTVAEALRRAKRRFSIRRPRLADATQRQEVPRSS